MTAAPCLAPAPRVSIVICTDGRAAALANTLRCLLFLDAEDFEVCVVRGPTEDGIAEVLAQWDGRIKHACNPEPNLSVSRNIGIAMATGEIIAFIEDDSLPEPAWLEQIRAAFDEPFVGGASGKVMDHTGYRAQHLYVTVDRLGKANFDLAAPADYFNFPLSFSFPHALGCNSAFRREALIAIGGFDEEFEFFLDDTDVCCRLVDAGWHMRQLSDAVVLHKFLPSAIRNEDRVTRVLYPVLKNKLYFSLVNNKGHYPVRRAIEDMTAFVAEQRNGLLHHVNAGRLPASDIDRYDADADRAWEDGLVRGLAGQRRLLRPDTEAAFRAPFLPFSRLVPADGREVFVFVSQEYPPGRLGGVGRYIHQMARGVAAMGHHVHVLTVGEGHDRLDFEDDVWVHRMAPHPARQTPTFDVPPNIWDHSSNMLRALRGIAQRQRVSAVYAPIWDCEAIAILADATVPVVLGLQTTMRFWLDSKPEVAADPDQRRYFFEPMIALETRMLREAAGVHAISAAIRRDIVQAYGVALDPPRTRVLPLGLEDWADPPGTQAQPRGDGALRLLFVGRLEARKGIAVLLASLPDLLARHPTLEVDLVGDDTLPGPDGQPYRMAFQASLSADLRARVHFHGKVDDAALRAFYRDCDIFVAPSRYESFGLILVESMMFAKPAVACRVGGMVEVIEDGVSGLLAEVDDVASLLAALERLISDPALRARLGAAARARYERHFSPQPMAEGIVAIMRAASQRAGAGTGRGA